MWCFSCFSPSTRQDDPSEDHYKTAIKISRHEEEDRIARQKREKDEEIEIERAKEINLKQFEQDEEKRRLEKSKEEGKREQVDDDQEDEQLALAIQESSRQQEEEEKRRRTTKLEEDAQIANAFLYEKREKKNDDKSALEDKEDEQLGKPSEESLKEKEKRKQLDEQVEKDEQLAVILQESLNVVKSPPRLEENNKIASRAAPLDEDEQRSILESLKGKGQITQSEDEVEDDGKLVEVNPPRSMCGGCNCEIEHGRSVDVVGVLWHPECFSCGVCHKPIAIHEVKNHVSNSRGKFHKSCYRRHCYVCKESVKMKSCNRHPFWMEAYCSAHESDGTHKCFCCERLEPRETNFVMLDDGRWLCLECMESAVMDTNEAQPLHFEIREFFEGLNMKIQKEFSLLLVERQALNKAEEEEKIDNQHGLVTRGICLSEAQTITSVSKGPKLGPNKQLIGMATESQRVVSGCEVTAILILYGLPRLQTGYILAHEMMHAYLRLNGHGKLNEVREEGLCQVLGHMWLESQTYAPIDNATASSAASSYSRTPEANASKKGDCSEFEKMLVEFCKYEIETNDSPVYGEGFRKVNQMVTDSSLQETLKEILRQG